MAYRLIDGPELAVIFSVEPGFLEILQGQLFGIQQRLLFFEFYSRMDSIS